MLRKQGHSNEKKNSSNNNENLRTQGMIKKLFLPKLIAAIITTITTTSTINFIKPNDKRKKELTFFMVETKTYTLTTSVVFPRNIFLNSFSHTLSLFSILYRGLVLACCSLALESIFYFFLSHWRCRSYLLVHDF